MKKLTAEAKFGDLPLGSFEGVVIYCKGKPVAKVYLEYSKKDRKKIAKKIEEAINGLT